MKKLYLFALAAMMFAACATDDTQDLRPIDAPETLTVGFEGGDDDTRVQLNSAGKTVWTKGDLVSVFYRSDANQKWQFQGETGDTNGKLKRISQGNTPNIGLDKVVAVYPYNENYLIELQTGNIQALLPSVQEYAEDSYGIGSSIMISSSRTDKLYLKNVCGWLKLQLTGDATIGYITLKGNNGEQVAGNVFITADDASCTLASDLNDLYGDGSGDLEGALIDPNTIASVVFLDCGNGVELGAGATAFYIALPPQTFEKGVTVNIVDIFGKAMTKSTENSLTIERNTIQPMAAFKFIPNTPTQPTPTNNEIWYTATAKVEPYDPDEFGATITSNVWDSDSGKGVITFNANVTKIGYYAFSECKKLKTITIPNSVTEIGSHAFYICTSLTSVNIPDSVTSIGSSAFSSCKSLTSITIPDSVTSIGSSAFSGCTGKLTVNCNIPSFSSSTRPFGSKFTELVIGDGVTSIGNYAFSGCSSLTSVTIPDSVTKIGGYAFWGCSSLTSVTIPDSVTSIGDHAFYECTSLTSVTIGNGVTEIGKRAFYACKSLKAFYGKFATTDNRCLIVDGVLNSFAPAGITSYTIPNSVTSIEGGAFYDCTSLTSITIPDSVTSIEGGAFKRCTSLTAFYGKFASEDNRCLIVNGVLNSFAIGCGATSYTIPDGVISIGASAFEGCTSLTSVTIPDSVTEIGYWAFGGCTSLTSVTIPDSVTEIGGYAFSGCTSLKEVYCKPTTPPTGGSVMFSNNASDRKIYVLASDDDSIINAYKSTQYWSNYASYIEEYDFSAGQ